jgi:hypothetical protein
MSNKHVKKVTKSASWFPPWSRCNRKVDGGIVPDSTSLQTLARSTSPSLTLPLAYLRRL